MSGTWPDDWHELHEKTSPGLLEMLGIPGVGPKRIKQLHDELGLESFITVAKDTAGNIHEEYHPEMVPAPFLEHIGHAIAV